MKEEQIIEVARELFHKFGFKKVSMDEIAREAGVTKKTIYHYFNSKEALLEYFIQEEIQNMKTIIEEVESKNMDFFDTVNEAICKLLKYRKEKDFLNVISREAEWLKDPILVKNLALIDTQIQNYIKSKLQKAKEKGFIEFTNLDVTAFLVYKMYIALIIEWSDKDKTMDEQMIANSISEVIKRGLRKEWFLLWKKKEF